MIGERLKELRKLNNLSQEQVAKELNITRQAISKWETDKTMPDIENIILLSKLYNVSLKSIMGEEEEKNIEESEKPIPQYNKKVTENELLGILMITIIICSSFLPQIGVAIAATFLILSKRIESTSIKRALRIVCVAAFFFSAYNLIEISKIMFVKYEGTVIPLN